MKVPVDVHIMLGCDTLAVADFQVPVTISAGDIVQAITDSHGLEAMHITDAAHNFHQFMKDIPQGTIDKLGLAPRKVIAAALHRIADRFYKQEGGAQ